MTIGICDDDAVFRQSMEKRLNRFLSGFLFEQFESGRELLFKLEEGNIGLDLLFLDIKMPYISGLQTAKKIRENGSQLPIIYLTAYEEFVFESFDTNPLHYLVKPVREEKLEQVVTKTLAEQVGASAPRTLLIKTRQGVYRASLRDIYFLEVFGRKLEVHTKQGKFAYYDTFSQLTKQLTAHGFFQIHRSILVNLDYVTYLDLQNKTVHINKNTKLPITTSRIDDFIFALEKEHRKVMGYDILGK